MPPKHAGRRSAVKWLASVVVSWLVFVTTAVPAIEATGRLKWFSSTTKLPQADVLEPLLGKLQTDLRVDLRVLLKHEIGPVRFEFDPTVTWSGGDAVQILNLGGFPLEQRPGSDSLRFFDWSDELIGTADYRVITRVDRLSASLRQPNWSLQIGRQAVSWGNGIVFQPLDLFSPFAPTTIDREFKPGVDSLLFESLVGQTSEFQALFIGRQESDLAPTAQSHTVALKWTQSIQEIAFDVLVAEHLGNEIVGFSMTAPVAGALVRSDVAKSCDEFECTTSGLVNVDYTIAIRQALLYVFGEVYHNGFGVKDLSEEIPARLTASLARGEVFTTMQNYASVGTNITWHPLWSQSFIVIRNIEDRSGLFQSAVTYDPSDVARIQMGVSWPVGEDNTEFGTNRIDEETTAGGNPSLFFSFSRYF
ncbi:MAG: hypothetical protein F4W90_06785 [Gammaproteobacteria bacterium]|nr:hypothetical protein [Gammaproteobacteria bacterium]